MVTLAWTNVVVFFIGLILFASASKESEKQTATYSSKSISIALGWALTFTVLIDHYWK